MLSLKVVEAKHVPKMDLFSNSSPFVECVRGFSGGGLLLLLLGWVGGGSTWRQQRRPRCRACTTPPSPPCPPRAPSRLFVRHTQRRQTSVQRPTRRPRWGDSFDLPVHAPDRQQLELILWDWDWASANDEIGRCAWAG